MATRSNFISLSIIMGTSLFAAACGDGASGDNSDVNDDDVTADAQTATPDSEEGTCVASTVLPANWRLIDMVSSGDVTAAPGAVFTADINATAGGLAGAADNPYTYVNLMTGAKVEISDVDSVDDATWHIAFKRASIKINGGDSGTGAVEAAMVDAPFDDVTTAPTVFSVDDWASDSCEFVSAPSGEPATAIGDWYDYNPDTHSLTPWDRTWVISVGGYNLKLGIDTYYGSEASPMSGGHYKIRWTPLS